MNNITVISTYATDVITDSRTGKTVDTPGGPALWIESFLNRCNLPYRIHTSETPAVVLITVTDIEETGISLDVPRVPVLADNERTAKIFLVSTIADEYDLYDLHTTKGLRALDVQGYVRSGFFAKPTHEIEYVHSLFDIVKMTESEMEKIPTSIVNSFKNGICLVTKGSGGFSLYNKGVETTFSASKIDANDTIGAGDTFFAAFCYEYSNSRNAIDAASYAKNQVETFLKNK